MAPRFRYFVRILHHTFNKICPKVITFLTKLLILTICQLSDNVTIIITVVTATNVFKKLDLNELQLLIINF